MKKDTGKESAFNEALFQMSRIGELQLNLNHLNLHPLGIEPQTMRRNYEIAIDTLFALYREASSKLSAGELKICETYRTLVLSSIKVKPVFSKEKVSNHGGTRNITKINEENWEFLRDVMHNYELVLRSYIEKHGLGSPNVQSPLESAYN